MRCYGRFYSDSLILWANLINIVQSEINVSEKNHKAIKIIKFEISGIKRSILCYDNQSCHYVFDSLIALVFTPVTNINLTACYHWPITKDRQSNEPIRTRSKYMFLSLTKARENVCKRGTIGSSFTSDWTKKWRKFFQPIRGVE